jgi:hypothetical protein
MHYLILRAGGGASVESLNIKIKRVHDKRGQEIELPASFDELVQVVSEALGIECVELWSDEIGTILMTISSVRNKAH